MIRVDFTSAAQSEFTELIRFYDRQGGTIASDFATELERVVERIVEFPDAGAPYSSGTRRILLYRFPVAVVYRARGSTLEVVALAHHRRRPDYWVLREGRRLYSGSVAEPVIITRHGRPVAALVGAQELEVLERLRVAGPEAGLVSLGPEGGRDRKSWSGTWRSMSRGKVSTHNATRSTTILRNHIRITILVKTRLPGDRA